MQQSTPINALRLAIFFIAAGLASASMTNMVLSEEKTAMSINGTLSYASLSFHEKINLFKRYEAEADRQYSSTAEARERFAVFEESLLKIDKLNGAERAANRSAVFGITIFSDLTDKEFQTTFLGTKPDVDLETSRRLMAIAPAAVRTTETSVDWRGIYTTPVKYQGPCGSCWAFSGVAQIESDAILAGLTTVNTILSTQQMTQCTYDYDGCLGGFPLTAYGYVARAGGITTEALYPYDPSTAFCDTTKNNYAVTVTMAYHVQGEQNMIDQVLAGKTLSVAVDANQWGPYKSGIFSGCSPDIQVNHAVNIVGVNVPEGYWIVRNSWGTWWGDNGYIKIALGSNQCGIDNFATYTDAATVGSVYIPPTKAPTKAPAAPVTPPTPAPVTPRTAAPSAKPVTPPTPLPSAKPIAPSANPSFKPVERPTSSPTTKPSAVPSASVLMPTKSPVAPPVTYLTRRPTRSRSPTRGPTSK